MDSHIDANHRFLKLNGLSKLADILFLGLSDSVYPIPLTDIASWPWQFSELRDIIYKEINDCYINSSSTSWLPL